MSHIRTSARVRTTVGVTAAALLLGAFVDAGVARAANSDFLFYGQAYGTKVTSSTGITASAAVGAGVFGGPSAQLNSNQAAAITAQGVISIGSISTTAQIKAIKGGWKVVTTATEEGVSILNGALTATSVTTRTQVSEIAGSVTADVTNTLVGLHIVGISAPKVIPKNWSIKLGSLARITVNSATTAIQNGGGIAIGAGIEAALLEPAGSADTGAIITVGPSETMIGPASAVSTGHANAGQAYGTSVSANVGTLVGVRSAPTAPIAVFAPGTAGQTTLNSVAGVHLGSGLAVGAVTDTGVGVNTAQGATTVTTCRVANINLFNGLLKASGIASAASASSNGTINGNAQFGSLVIGGVPINLNVVPNTVITVAHVGQVIVNQQIRTAHGITVRALDIVMSVKRNGLPVGAEIQICVALASAT